MNTPSIPNQPAWSITIEVIDAHRAQVALCEVENLMSGRRTFAGNQVELIVAIEMYLEGLIAYLLTIQQFGTVFGLPGVATKVGNQSNPEMMPFSTLPAGTWPGQRIMQAEESRSGMARHDRARRDREAAAAALARNGLARFMVLSSFVADAHYAAGGRARKVSTPRMSIRWHQNRL
jgi:hypothetical protein